MNSHKANPPQGFSVNIPVELVGQGKSHKRRYTRADQIQKLAVEIYTKTGKGVKFSDLVHAGIAKEKSHAQHTLKRFLERKILFTPFKRRPQEYYPTNMKSEIMKSIYSKNVPLRPTGVEELAGDMQLQTLVDYVIPILPEIPLHIHNMHLAFKIDREYYQDLQVGVCKGNRGKPIQEAVGAALVTCIVYPKGTVDVQISCNNKPFSLELYVDVARLLVFLGQVKAFVTSVLHDPRERFVPDIMEWILTECELNKDVVVQDIFHLASLKIQSKVRVRHLEFILRIYFKSMGEDTVCRVEANISPKRTIAKILTGLVI